MNNFLSRFRYRPTLFWPCAAVLFLWFNVPVTLTFTTTNVVHGVVMLCPFVIAAIIGDLRNTPEREAERAKRRAIYATYPRWKTFCYGCMLSAIVIAFMWFWIEASWQFAVDLVEQSAVQPPATMPYERLLAYPEPLVYPAPEK